MREFIDKLLATSLNWAGLCTAFCLGMVVGASIMLLFVSVAIAALKLADH